jgi:hypothetical protein
MPIAGLTDDVWDFAMRDKAPQRNFGTTSAFMETKMPSVVSVCQYGTPISGQHNDSQFSFPKPAGKDIGVTMTEGQLLDSLHDSAKSQIVWPTVPKQMQTNISLVGVVALVASNKTTTPFSCAVKVSWPAFEVNYSFNEAN